MTTKAGRYREFGKVTIGGKCIVDDDVIIGYPPKDVLLTKGTEHSLATKIGPRCVLRSGTVVYATSSLGADVHLGHHVIIREGVRVGDKSKIGSLTEIAPNVKVGKDCRIVGCSFIGNETVFGDHVFVAPGLVTVNRKFSPPFFERREDGEPMEPPEVGDHVLIGPNVTLSFGVRIGRRSIIASGCVVTKEVPPGSIVAGVPGRVVGSVADKFGRGRT